MVLDERMFIVFTGAIIDFAQDEDSGRAIAFAVVGLLCFLPGGVPLRTVPVTSDLTSLLVVVVVVVVRL